MTSAYDRATERPSVRPYRLLGRGGASEKYKPGLPCTSLILDIHVMIN